jgi:VanZ family protein
MKQLLSENFFRLYFLFTLSVIEFLATTTIHIEVVESIWDKANHFSAFFVLYILLSLGFRNLTTFKKAILLLLYGMQIEVVQSFIDGRFFSPYDVVADSVGILIGVVVYGVISSYFKRVRT